MYLLLLLLLRVHEGPHVRGRVMFITNKFLLPQKTRFWDIPSPPLVLFSGHTVRDLKTGQIRPIVSTCLPCPK
jgi:hypothetical protein